MEGLLGRLSSCSIAHIIGPFRIRNSHWRYSRAIRAGMGVNTSYGEVAKEIKTNFPLDASESWQIIGNCLLLFVYLTNTSDFFYFTVELSIVAAVLIR